MKLVLATCVLCLFAATASAQSLKLPTIVYGSVMAADWVSTIAWMPPGTEINGRLVREANPLVNWMESNPPLMYATGVVMDVTALWAIHKTIGKKHPKATRILLYAVTGARTVIVVRNMQMNHRLSR